MSRVAISAKEAEDFRAGKVVKKKKGSGSKDANWNSNAEKPKREKVEVYRSNISALQLRGVMNETVWRVQNEINPAIDGSEAMRMNSDESSYVLSLTMLLGVGVDGMHKGLKIREYEYGDAPDCGDHD